MSKINLTISSILLVIAALFFPASPAISQNAAPPIPAPVATSAPQVNNFVEVSDIKLNNPIEGNPTVPLLLGRIISSLLGIVGSLTLLAFIYGGFTWLTSAGSPEKVKKGTNTMVYTIIGLFVIFAAYAILNTIISGLR